eukprot:GGOE01054727.1.p1 GENE.GGOE01054727.1~~GGOE01054727.1.p1  ORF type:complete len:538 (+),score=145.15 GGOE01054727.1:157-1770(+)
MVRIIGQGASGTCHLVRERHTGQTFVLKMMHRSMGDERQRDPMQEVQMQSAIHHPNTIALHDHFMSPQQRLCIVLEYADGGDLDALLYRCQQAGTELDEATVLDLFLQLCLAVNACHERNLIHRDLKLQNVFLTSDGVVKLGDFGVARVVIPHLDLAQTLIGTPFYLSPEVLQARPYDIKSDVWALGVVLYELMALHRPFQARDIAELKAEVLALRFDPLPERFSAELRALVTSMLQLDPCKRPSVEALLDSKPLRRRQRQWLQGGAGIHVPAEYVQRVASLGLLTVAVPSDMAEWVPRSRSRSVLQEGIMDGRPPQEVEAELLPDHPAPRRLSSNRYKGSSFLSDLEPSEAVVCDGETEDPSPAFPRSVSFQCPPKAPTRLSSIVLPKPLPRLRSRIPTPRSLVLDHAPLCDALDTVVSARGSNASLSHWGGVAGVDNCSFEIPALKRCGSSVARIHPLERSLSTMRHHSLKPLPHSPKAPETGTSPTCPWESVFSFDPDPSTPLPSLLVENENTFGPPSALTPARRAPLGASCRT